MTLVGYGQLFVRGFLVPALVMIAFATATAAAPPPQETPPEGTATSDPSKTIGRRGVAVGQATHQRLGTPAKQLYRKYASAADLSIVFDTQLKDVSVEVELGSTAPQEALRRIALTAGHFIKKIDEHTILVADDTPQNRREYERLAIRIFVLENIAAEQAASCCAV